MPQRQGSLLEERDWLLPLPRLLSILGLDHPQASELLGRACK